MRGCGSRPRERKRSTSRRARVRTASSSDSVAWRRTSSTPFQVRPGSVASATNRQASSTLMPGRPACAGGSLRRPAAKPARATSSAATRACRSCTANSSSIASVSRPFRAPARAPPAARARAEVVQKTGDGGVVGRRSPAPGQQLGLEGRAPAVLLESDDRPRSMSIRSARWRSLMSASRTVEPVVGDEALDRRRHEVADRPSGVDPFADHARRDADGHAGQHDDLARSPPRGRLLDGGGIVAGARRHDQQGAVEDRSRLVPGRELQQGVGPGDEGQRRPAVATLELRQGVAGEAQSQVDLGRDT